MIAFSVANLNFFFAGNFSFNKARKESLDQYRRLEVREKARNVFSHLHQVFSISLGFSRFFRSYFVLPNFWGLIKEFNKTIIPFTLVGYETGYFGI